MRGVVVLLVCCLAVVASPSIGWAWAPPVHGNVRSGIRCYENLNYSCAVTRLTRALEDHRSKRQTLTAAQQLVVHERLAFSYASQGAGEGAEKAFGHCLDLQLDYALDASVISPKIYKHYAAAVERHVMERMDRTPRSSFTPEVVTPSFVERGLLIIDRPNVAASGPMLSGAGRHELNAELGAMMLFGADAERFYPGVGVGLQYVHAVTNGLEVEGVVHFYQHLYAANDLKAGYSGTLYNVDVGVGLRTGIRLGRRAIFVFGLRTGLGMMGVENLTDSLGAFVAIPVGVDVAVTPGFLIGLSVAPTITTGQDVNDSLAASVSLPIVTRFRVAF